MWQKADCLGKPTIITDYQKEKVHGHHKLLLGLELCKATLKDWEAYRGWAQADSQQENGDVGPTTPRNWILPMT